MAQKESTFSTCVAKMGFIAIAGGNDDRVIKKFRISRSTGASGYGIYSRPYLSARFSV